MSDLSNVLGMHHAKGFMKARIGWLEIIYRYYVLFCTRLKSPRRTKRRHDYPSFGMTKTKTFRDLLP